MMTTEAPARPATPTERKIAEMLVENTGAAMMDSGGIYGRRWQTTRARYGLDGGLPNSSYSGFPGHTPVAPDEDDIERVARTMRDEPVGGIDEWGEVIVDTFHWLVDRLEYDPALDAKFQRYSRLRWAAYNAAERRWLYESGERPEDIGDMTIASDFAQLCNGSGGIYPGEGDLDNAWTNTYNGEDALDRTLQFLHFHVSNGKRSDREPHLPEGSYVLLQIHGGCDVRGGYTDPVLFQSFGEQADLYDNDREEVWCEGASEIEGGAVPGQIKLEGGEAETIYHQHRWDNSYGDGKLRLTYRDGEWVDGGMEPAGVLAFPREDDEPTETIQIEHGYTKETWIAGNYPHAFASMPTHWVLKREVIRPDRYAVANNARLEYLTDAEDKVIGHVWHCPFDDSPLFASGAVVG